MAVLDDLSGVEFEDIMEDVFRNLGYDNVRQAVRTADEGRDILMEEVVDGTRTAVVVECKHTGTVGRPVVQKLHSAIATFNHDGPKRGIVVTTGRFTNPAVEYAERLQQTGDPHPIELIDGGDLREIADEIGLNLYNGRIEVLCDDTLRPYDQMSSVSEPFDAAFRNIENIDRDDVPPPTSWATFRPVLTITAMTNAVFETSVGVVHRVNEETQFVIHADRGHPTVADKDIASLVATNLHSTVELDEEHFEGTFDEVDRKRFGKTETEYKTWAVDKLQRYHTTTVTYTGDNNVTYNKTCEPNVSDISIRSMTPVFLPQVRLSTDIQAYTYPYEYYAAGPSRVTSEDGVRRCVHCGTDTDGTTYTFCANCGSINCPSHTKTERLEGSPICTGCAVTERFALKTKYFYDQENLQTFQEEYDAMPLHQKAMENKLLVAGGVIVTLLILTQIIISAGIL